jgi:hypothetical protein
MSPDDIQKLLAAVREISAIKWTEIATFVLLLASAVAALVATIYARLQIREDHTRSRRQYAIEICARWSEFTSAETASVTRLIERLSDEQCAAIANLTKLKVEVDYKPHLVNILELRFPDIETRLDSNKEGTNYLIDGKYLIHLRHIAVRYLNMLESVLLSWTLGVADQEMILKEFSFLFDETKNRTAMRRFREKIGNEGFPSIERFIHELKPKLLDPRRETGRI